MELDWLFARPIAHRGLHDRANGIVENTPTAVARAIESGYAIEIDVRETADGEAVVFHDATLDRLTEATGALLDAPLLSLRTIPMRGTTDRIWTLDECFDLVDGRATLVVEIKAPWGRDSAFSMKVAEAIARRRQPIAVKSFNPRALIAARTIAPKLPRGIIGEAFADDDPSWSALGGHRRKSARELSHLRFTQPHFVSWDIEDVERASVAKARASGLPVMTWTVRGEEQRAKAARFADQIVFEGFLPAVQNL